MNKLREEIKNWNHRSNSMKINYNKFINHMRSVSSKQISGELNMSKN